MTDSSMETLSQAMARLRGDGFVEEYRAADASLLCGRCQDTHEPTDVTVVEVVRFEGTSDPGDEAILYAIDAGCGHRGLYTAAYGPAASSADALVLRALPATRQQ